MTNGFQDGSGMHLICTDGTVPAVRYSDFSNGVIVMMVKYHCLAKPRNCIQIMIMMAMLLTLLSL